MKKGNIKTSYGEVATVNGMPTGFLFGAGYGKDADLATYADLFAEILSKNYGLEIVKRGNSDGRSAGAYYDEGQHCIGIRAYRLFKDTNTIRFSAMFFAKGSKEDFQDIPQSTIGYDHKDGIQGIYSQEHETPDKAIRWLETYGPKYCERLKR